MQCRQGENQYGTGIEMTHIPAAIYFILGRVITQKMVLNNNTNDGRGGEEVEGVEGEGQLVMKGFSSRGGRGGWKGKVSWL